MSEAEFKIGDRVRVVAERSAFKGHIGQIDKMKECGARMAFRVKSSDNSIHPCYYYGIDLEPALTANECLTVDNVNHPPHYNQGGIECLEAIKAALGDGFTAYLRGNVMKYLWRCEHKGGIEDLRKAAFYLDRAIKEMEVTSE